MSKAIAIGIVGLALSAAMLGLGFVAGKSGASPGRMAPTLTDSAPESVDRAHVEAIVRDYLVSNPEVMLDVQQALDARERETRLAAQRNTIAEQADELFNAAYDGMIGNPDGDVTIVEFFDYNCGFCKRALQDMETVLAADPDVRFVLKEFPILGPDSQAAHVVSMAFLALWPENYPDFHRELIGANGRVDEAAAIRVALAHGADEDELRQAMEDPAIMDAFERTYTLANRLSVTGTPSYVIGEEVVFGAQGSDVLFEKVELARESGG